MGSRTAGLNANCRHPPPTERIKRDALAVGGIIIRRFLLWWAPP